MTEQKTATFKIEPAEHGYTKFSITYPSGKTHTRYLPPDAHEGDAHELRSEIMCWAEERGYLVIDDTGGFRSY